MLIRYRLRPRVLVDVSQVDTRVELFGGWVEFPICVAPTAMHGLAHSDAETATAKGTVLNNYSQYCTVLNNTIRKVLFSSIHGHNPKVSAMIL